MKKFNGEPSCDKCGHYDFDWEYNNQATKHTKKPDTFEEFLVLTCRRCGYVDYMEVMFSGEG